MELSLASNNRVKAPTLRQERNALAYCVCVSPLLINSTTAAVIATTPV